MGAGTTVTVTGIPSDAAGQSRRRSRTVRSTRILASRSSHLCQAATAIIMRFMRFSTLIPMSRQRVLAMAMALMCSMAPMASAACSFQEQHLSPAQVRAAAQQPFRRATAVIDAEVVMPMNAGAEWKTGLVPAATLKVIKVWKGHVSGDVALAVYISSCDIVMERKGQKFRILLSGSDIFHAE